MTAVPGHIGIVGGSAEGAALCYRTICVEGTALLGPHAHPEVSMHTRSLADTMARVDDGDWPGVGERLLDSAEKLARIGADFLICPDNTFHQALAHIEARLPLPWLHIADAVIDEARERGFRRVGLTGTRWLVASDVYPSRLAAAGIECIRPAPEDRDAASRIIMDELVYGEFRPESIDLFLRVIEGFRSGGCDAVILGCTEIPLIVDDGNSALPTLDSTRLLARAALGRAVHGARP